MLKFLHLSLVFPSGIYNYNRESIDLYIRMAEQLNVRCLACFEMVNIDYALEVFPMVVAVNVQVEQKSTLCSYYSVDFLRLIICFLHLWVMHIFHQLR